MASRSPCCARNRAKPDWGDICNQADPRAYFNTLAPPQYMIPERVKPVFQSVFRALQETRGLESEGRTFAEFFLSRPAGEAGPFPLSALMEDAVSAPHLAEASSRGGR